MTAEVELNGKTFETNSLTAAEAIADNEVREAFTSSTGAISAVTKNGNIIAGANATKSLNSESAVAALKAVGETAEFNMTDDGEVEIPLISIYAGQEIETVSSGTIKKILEAAEQSGINTRIQKRQYTEDANGRADELIYRITLPLEAGNIRDLRLGAEFNSDVVNASV
jgi:hypothetical protein